MAGWAVNSFAASSTLRCSTSLMLRPFQVTARGYERVQCDVDVDDYKKCDVILDEEQPPFVEITNAPSSLGSGVTSCLLCGTNNAHVEGTMWWSNHGLLYPLA